MTSSLLSAALPATHTLFLGHEKAEDLFMRAWNTQHVHHAWLISGPSGIGKATFAYRIARFMLTKNYGDAISTLETPPGDPVVARVAQRMHGDFYLLAPQKDGKEGRIKEGISVTQVRNLAECLSKTSIEQGWRVVLIDSVDEMTHNSANALLKLLEEPPPMVVFLAISHAFHRVLPTLRSRCFSLPLKPLSQSTSLKLLAHYRPDLSEHERVSLSLLAEGSLGQALGLANHGGLKYYQDLVSHIRSLSHLDVPSLHEFTERIAKSPDAFRVTSQLLLWWLARAIGCGAWESEPEEVFPGENGTLRTFLLRSSLDRLAEVWDTMRVLFADAESRYLDRKHVLTRAFLMIEPFMRSAA